MSSPMVRKGSHSMWPQTGAGRAAMIVACLAVLIVVVVLFALPVIGEVIGAELLPGVLNTWLTPLILAALLDSTAVLSVVAWRRGERSGVAQMVLWLSLAGGALLTFDVLMEALAGR